MATTFKKTSPERKAYLTSLNKKGSPNYRPTPDDKGYENMDIQNNAAIKAGLPQPTPTPTTPTDISQPSPATAQVQPPNQGIVNFDAKTGAPLAPGASTTDSLGNVSTQGSRFKQAHAQLVGQPVSQDAGQAMIQAKGAIPPQAPDMSATDALLMEDKGWQGLMQMKEEYFNPDNQKVSLMDTYNKLYKKSGLDQLDEEIIDAKTIIEGTEDDIRNEIEQAGGFGSDSQVQALALSRNKVLLKNYNNLVAMRESKAEHLGTMMNLAEKDRAYADQQFDKMLNFDMQMLNFRDKFVQNARDQYNKYEPAQLQAMLAGNPRQLAFAESILGVGQGGLAKLASMPRSEEDQLDLDYKKGQIALQKSNLKTDEAQRSKLYAETKALNTPTTEGLTTAQGKPMNVEQSKAYGFGTRTLQAGKTISDLEQTFAKQPSTVKIFGMNLSPNKLLSEDAQKYEQAKRNFINAVLRRESGASISPSEFENAEKQYFPRYGDKSENLEAKKQNRTLVTKNLLQESGIDVGDVTTLTLSPQGDLIRITD